MSEIKRHLQKQEVRGCLSAACDVKQTARDFFQERGFREFDTPILIPRTGERYNTTFNVDLDGNPAMLADSPQICKMMLMMAGYEKYYQFAHCFRSIAREDNPDTRLSEFIQLDIEVRDIDFDGLVCLAEQFMIRLCKSLHRFPKVTYLEGFECLEKYGEAMKPDLRECAEDLSVVFIKRLPLVSRSGVPFHHIFAKPHQESVEWKNEEMASYATESFDIILNGIEVGGGDLRIMDVEMQRRLMGIFDVDEKLYTGYLEMLAESKEHQSGGFAIGLERLLMALLSVDNICQTVAFPNIYMSRDWCL
ncbi:MAG: hypothetical protein K2L82_06480 [Lachnospiraceae bacterium]|nr:hypothetical protein [Lachnospiraceae bacterium]